MEWGCFTSLGKAGEYLHPKHQVWVPHLRRMLEPQGGGLGKGKENAWGGAEWARGLQVGEDSWKGELGERAVVLGLHAMCSSELAVS